MVYFYFSVATSWSVWPCTSCTRHIHTSRSPPCWNVSASSAQRPPLSVVHAPVSPFRIRCIFADIRCWPGMGCISHPFPSLYIPANAPWAAVWWCCTTFPCSRGKPILPTGSANRPWQRNGCSWKQLWALDTALESCADCSTPDNRSGPPQPIALPSCRGSCSDDLTKLQQFLIFVDIKVKKYLNLCF